VKRAFILLLSAYQKAVSPFLGTACRFVPTCSQYAVEAIEQHGAMKGLRLAGVRLLKCQPFVKGGLDMVTPRYEK